MTISGYLKYHPRFGCACGDMSLRSYWHLAARPGLFVPTGFSNNHLTTIYWTQMYCHFLLILKFQRAYALFLDLCTTHREESHSCCQLWNHLSVWNLTTWKLFNPFILFMLSFAWLGQKVECKQEFRYTMKNTQPRAGKISNGIFGKRRVTLQSGGHNATGFVVRVLHVLCSWAWAESCFKVKNFRSPDKKIYTVMFYPSGSQPVLIVTPNISNLQVISGPIYAWGFSFKLHR